MSTPPLAVAADPAPRRSTAGALALLAAASGTLTALLAGRGWFYYDDFWNLTVAQDLGWGWDLLGRPVFGHVIPGANLLIGLVAGRGPAPYGWAVALVAAFGAAVPVVAAWTCRQVGASPRRAVVAAALVASAAPLATLSTWWSASVTVHPSLLAGMVVVGAVEAGRRGASWGFPVAAAALFVGMSCSEGAVVTVLPPLVLWLADLTGGPRSRLAAVWADRARWSVLLLALVAVAIVRASASSPIAHPPRPPLLDVVRFSWSFLARGFVPSLVGPVSNRTDLLGRPGLTAVVGCGVVLGAFGWAWRTSGQTVVVAGAAVLAAVVARAVLVAWGRLEVLGWGAAVEGRYYADLVWLVPVVVIGRWPRNRRARAAAPDRALRWALVAVGVLGVVGQLAIAVHAPSVASGSYRHRLADSWSEASGDVAVVDSIVPAEVIGPQFGPFAFLSRSAGRGTPHLRFGPAARYLAPDPRGRLRPVRLGPVADLVVGRAFTAIGEPGVRHHDGCWVAGDRPALVWVPLTVAVATGPWILDLRLRGPSDRHVRFVAAGRSPARYLATSGVGRTERRWLVAATPFDASQIGVELSAGARFCLAGGSLDQVVPTP